MKFKISKEQCLNLARMDDGDEVGAGLLARDPMFESPTLESVTVKDAVEINGVLLEPGTYFI